MMFPYMLPNLIVSCLAFRSSHIQLIHAHFHFNVAVDVEFGQKENGLAMLRPREEVHGLDLLCMVAVCGEPLGVAGGGGRVTADVDDPAGRHFDDGRQGGFVTALAGRVEDDDVGVQTLGGKLGRSLPRIGAEEAALGGDSVAHPGGIGLRAVDGFGYDLDADQLPAGIHHRQADGAHPAVEIQQQIVGGELGVVGGDAVKLLRGEGVDLIEGQWPEPNRNALQGVFDESGTVQGKRFMAEDHIGVLGVDIQEDGGDLRELRTELLHQFVGMGDLGAGADQTDHDLAAVYTPPQEDVTDKPLAALLVVGLDAVRVEEGTQRVADRIQKAGLKLTVRAGNDPVGAACVETDAGLAGLIPPHRELHLVAVTVHFGGSKDRQDGNLQPADPPERVGHVVLLGGKLRFVPEMAQAAAAAGPGRRTIHRDAVGRGGQQLVQNAEGIPAAVLDDPDPGGVAGGRTRDEDRFAVFRMGDAAAVVGQPLDLQVQQLIFL